MRSPLIRILLVLLVIVPASAARAAVYLTSDFDSNIGFTSLNVRVGSSFRATLESSSTLEFNYNLNFSGSATSVVISLFEMVKSEMGMLPLTRLALGYKWYPFHLNGGRFIADTGVEGRVWKATPFLESSFGATNISVKIPTDPSVGSFNAFVVDAFVKAGVEVPAGSDWLLMGQFGYLVSMLGNNPDPARVISYNGIAVLFGFKLNTF